jgi:hypothetical protein
MNTHQRYPEGGSFFQKQTDTHIIFYEWVSNQIWYSAISLHGI